MKKSKILLTFPIAISALFFSSCSSNSKISITYGKYQAETFEELNYNSFEELVKDKMSFILAVEPTTSCACWTNFKPILNNYISSKNALIYHMKYEMFEDNKTYNLNLRKGYTTFAIFEDGSLRHNLISEEQKIFKEQEAFNSFMESAINLPHFLYINFEQLKTLSSKSEKNIFYFSRSGCGDCSYVNRNFLPKYAKSNINQKDVYILDCDQMAIDYSTPLYDESHNPTPFWKTFKQDWGLGNKYNTLYGYDDGYVPTFLLINSENGKLNFSSGAVYFNDSIEKVNSVYKVTNSYYTSERLEHLEYLKDFNGTKVLKGLELKNEEVSSSYWNQVDAAKYHDPLLEQFLNYYTNLK